MAGRKPTKQKPWPTVSPATLTAAGLALFWGAAALLYRRFAPKGARRLLLFAGAVMAIVAWGVERFVLRKLVNQEGIILFMATIGITFFLEGLAQTVFGADVYPLNIGLPKEPIFLLESLFDARADAAFVAHAVERLHDQVPAAGGRFDPRHAVDGRFVMELHRFPLLGAVGRRNEVEHRAALDGVSRIPAGADGDLRLAVAVDIARGDAHVVFLGEVLGDDVLLPGRVLIPLHRGLVGQDDVGLDGFECVVIQPEVLQSAWRIIGNNDIDRKSVV